MPCNSGQGDDHTDYVTRRKLDETTALLCELVSVVRAAGLPLQGPLLEFAMRHEAEDARRRELEAKRESDIREAQAALRKLTERERQLLGLPVKL